jgi:formylglycine-generating enzyme
MKNPCEKQGSRLTALALVLAATLAVGCSKKDDEGGARNASTVGDAPAAFPEDAGGGGVTPGTGGAPSSTGGAGTGEPAPTGGSGGMTTERPPWPPYPLGKCPEGLPGPPLVAVPGPLGSYCIDATEVTRGQYQRFVEAGYTKQVDPQEQGVKCVDGEFEGTQLSCDAEELSRACEGNVYEPTERVTQPPAGSPCLADGTCQAVDRGCTWWLEGMDDYPINCIDWCDAAGYCEWAGKRLCGSAALGRNELRIACEGRWLAGQDFEGSSWNSGYWLTNDLAACNYDHGDPYDGLSPVGALKTCEGGYPGIFDLKGNVYEFVEAGAGSSFTALGGAFDSVELNVSVGGWTSPTGCDAYQGASARDVFHNVGFRCCADVLPEGS